MPARIAAFLRVVHVLIGYGRHLAETVQHRALTPGFSPIAASFGTANLSVILNHLQRGMLRAMALQRVLLARAARGRDIRFASPRNRKPHPKPAPTDAGANLQATSPQRTAAPKLLRCSGHDHSADFHTPTLLQLEAQVRRRPLGRTIVDICLDLAVVPGFCTGPFWNELFELTRCYGGNIATIVKERCRREQAFDQEQDRRPTRDWNWPDQGRAAIRQTLGFFIGEAPAALFDFSPPSATTATGPP